MSDLVCMYLSPHGHLLKQQNSRLYFSQRFDPHPNHLIEPFSLIEEHAVV